MDLNSIEDSLRKAYDDQLKSTSRHHGSRTDRKQNTIPPSDIPDKLPTQESSAMEGRTVVVKEDIPACLKRRRVETSEEEDSDKEEKRSWLRSTRTRQADVPEVVPATVFDGPSEDDEEGGVLKKDRPKCPFYGCEVRTKRIRNHVNRMHLPKLMWDNHYPPVRPDRMTEFNQMRLEVLEFLAQRLVGTRNCGQLLEWCHSKQVIPERAKILGRQIEQMRSFTDTLGWKGPSFNRYTLFPPNHRSVLIQWRYQVGMVRELSRKDLEQYLNFGIAFMNDPANFLMPTVRNKAGETCLSRGMMERTVNKRGNPTWDESDDTIRQPVEPVGLVTMDEVGETDDSLLSQQMGFDDKAVVKIGSNKYTLVIRGLTLDISCDSHRRPSAASYSRSSHPRQSSSRQPTEVQDVYDSHFHLDRSSKRLLKNDTLSLDRWLGEPMERPPRIPVNVVGGTLIYCDPETYPTTVPIDPKWRVAVGLHPKNVRNMSEAQKRKFMELIKSDRVAAVGEIGLDRTIGWHHSDKQLKFLREIAPIVKDLGKPVILHIRSDRHDLYSQLAYLVVLKYCADDYTSSRQRFVLHCFTGTQEIVDAWLRQFRNTYFGITMTAARFDGKQRNALRAIPDDRLLVETDAPYITPPGISNNSPIYIGEVITEVASIRGQTVEEVAKMTRDNAKVFGWSAGR